MSESNPVELINAADIALHRGVQYLALTSLAFIESEVDDSHTNLGWNAERKRIEGRWFHAMGNEYRLTLSPSSYELIWEDRNRTVLERFQLSGSSELEVREWWENTAATIGGKSVAHLELNYELPKSALYQASNLPSPTSEMINVWVRWRSLGQKALSVIVALMESEVQPRIWPHHFDTGIFGKFNDEASLGCGISPADHLMDEPYIYLYGWKSGTYMAAPSSPLKNGMWIPSEQVGDWSGFVLSYSQAIHLELSEIKMALVQASQSIIEA